MYILAQAISSYLQGEDIYIHVGRLIQFHLEAVQKFKQSAMRASEITNGWAEYFYAK